MPKGVSGSPLYEKVESGLMSDREYVELCWHTFARFPLSEDQHVKNDMSSEVTIISKGRNSEGRIKTKNVELVNSVAGE